jgi:predicted MFS family arabinose efflux permease
MLFALFMTSLCREYYQLFLAQGLLLGLGISFVLLPAFATIPHYFVRSRGLALGVVVSGSSLGGVVWPIALKNLLSKVGFGWGVRISAFIMLPLLALACVTVRLPAKVGSHTKPKPDLSIAKNPVLLGVAGALFFVFLGLFSPFFYITSWTISLGHDESLGFYMVSIINASSLFGRILPGMLADRVGAFNIMILSAGISGIICACWTKATSIGGIIVLSLAYGFSSGVIPCPTLQRKITDFVQAVISLQGACAAKVAQPQQYGVAMGVVMSILSIAGLIGSPINGQLLDAFGYLGLSLFSGLTMILGMLIMTLAKLKLNPKFLALT